MNIYLGSDFHIDFWKSGDLQNPIKKLQIDLNDYDLFLLAGDIGEADNQIRYQKFLTPFLESNKPVVTVLGNHEFYNSEYSTVYDKIKNLFLEYKNFFILENNYVDLVDKNIRIWGATLWTDFNKNDPFVKFNAKRYMNDYRMCKNLTLELVANNHIKSLESLKRAYDTKPKDFRFVAMTHHAPSLEASYEYHKIKNNRPDISDYYYGSNLDSYLITNSIYPDLWVHGHIHADCQYYIADGKIKVICSPFGYPGEKDLIHPMIMM